MPTRRAHGEKKARRALACPPRTEPCIYLHEKISRRHLVVPLTDCRSLLVVFVVGLFHESKSCASAYASTTGTEARATSVVVAISRVSEGPATKLCVDDKTRM